MAPPLWLRPLLLIGSASAQYDVVVYGATSTGIMSGAFACPVPVGRDLTCAEQ